jgi:hypothetical protein
MPFRARHLHWTVALLIAAGARRRQRRAPLQTRSRSAGKDVVWVPTPEALVEKMLDLAQGRPERLS